MRQTNTFQSGKKINLVSSQMRFRGRHTQNIPVEKNLIKVMVRYP